MARLASFTIDVLPTLNPADLTAAIRRAEQSAPKLTLKTTVDDASLTTQASKITAALSRAATIKLKFDTPSLTAEIARIKGSLNSALEVKVKLTGTAQARNDLAVLNRLLSGLQTNMQYRVTVQTTALAAVNTQIQTQIVQLQSLISQLRSLGGAGGGGAGGGGSRGPSLPPGVQAALLEVDRLNNLFTRGQISSQNYGQALTAMQNRLIAAAQAAGRGTEEFKRIDGQITKITQNLRSINTDSLNKVRADASALRLAFDAATGGISRNSQQFKDAAKDYQTGAAQIEARLNALKAAANTTAPQLKQINTELARLAREQGTLSGGSGLNFLGLSGNVANALGAALPVLQQAGGSLGAAAGAAALFGGSLFNLAKTGGPAVLALGGLAIAAAGTAVAFVKLGTIGLDEVGKLQKGMNVLQANGVTDLDAVSDSVAALQTSLGKVGQTFTRGDLTLASADIVKAGVNVNDSLTLMSASTKLAAAEQINLGDASNLLLKNLRQYGLAVTDASKVGDMLAQAGNLAAGSANDLSVGLGIVGGSGKAAKVEMYDLLGMLIELDNKGMSAADVGANGLRSALSSLAGISEKGKGALKSLNIEFEDTAGKARPAGDILKDLGEKMRGLGITFDKTTGELIGNGEGFKTVSDIMDNRAAAAVLNLTGDWKGYGQVVKDSIGYSTEYSNITSQGVEQSQKRLSTAFKDSGGAFAKSFAAPLANFLDDTLTPLVKKFGDFLELLDKAKKSPEISVDFKIKPGDDLTTQVLKFLGGAGAVLNATEGKGALTGTSGDFIKSSNLAQQLRENGVFPNVQGGAALAQISQVSKNFDHYARLLQQKIEKDAAEGKKSGLPGAGGLILPFSQNSALNTPGTTLFDLNPTAFDKGNELGQQLAGAAVIGLKGATTAVAGECSKFVRQVFQQAFGKNAGAGLFGASALQTEANFKKAGLSRAFKSYDDLKSGEVLFNAKDKSGAGHAGIVVIIGGKKYVAENSSVVAAASATGDARALTPVERYGGITTVGNINSYKGALPLAGKGSPVDPFARDKRILEEGKHLLAQYNASLLTTNEIWQKRALEALDAFKKKNKAAYTTITKKGGGPDEALTADQILRAQQLVANLDKAQTASRAAPLDVNLTKNLGAATQAMKKFSEASESNARALTAVQGAQGGVNKKAGEYIATAAEQKKYGADALRLIKLQETAKASGDPDQVNQAKKALALFIGENEKRAAVIKSVLDAEGQAYDSRKQAATKTEADDKKSEQRQKEAARNAGQIAESTRSGNVVLATQQLEKLNALREKDLKAAGENAAKKVQIEQDYSKSIYNSALKVAAAQKKVDDAKANNGPAQLKDQGLKTSQGVYEAALRKADADRLARSGEAGKALKDQQAKFADELGKLQIDKAQATNERLKALGQAQIDAAGDDLRKKLSLTKTLSQEQATRELAIAELTRKQAVGKATKDGGPNMGQAIENANAAYQLSATKIEQDRKRSVAEAGKAETELRKQISAQLSQLTTQEQADRVQAERDELTRLQDSQKAQLDVYKDNAVKRLEIVQDTVKGIQAQEERLALTQLVAAKNAASKTRQTALDAIPKGATAGEVSAQKAQINKNFNADNSAAYRAYYLELGKSAQEAAQSVQSATESVTSSIDGLSKRYESTTATFAKKLFAGDFTDEDVTAYLRDLNTLLADAQKSGVDGSKGILALRNAARELLAITPDIQAALKVAADAASVAQKRYGDKDALAQYAIRGSYGTGATGYQAALDGFGVRSIDELSAINPEAAKAMQVVYKDVLDKMVSDLQDAADRAQAIVSQVTQDIQAEVDSAVQKQDSALAGKDGLDKNRVDNLFKANGQFAAKNAADFLKGGDFFGDQFYSGLGEAGKTAFLAQLDKLKDEDYSYLGKDVIGGLLAGIGDNADFQALAEKLKAGLGIALSRTSADVGYTDLGNVAVQDNALQAGLDNGSVSAKTYADTLRDDVLPQLERIKKAATDPELQKAASGAIDGVQARLGELDNLITYIQDRVNQVSSDADLGKLISRPNGLDAVYKGFQEGTDSAQKFIDALKLLRPELNLLAKRDGADSPAGRLLAQLDADLSSGAALVVEQLAQASREATDADLGKLADQIQQLYDSLDGSPQSLSILSVGLTNIIPDLERIAKLDPESFTGKAAANILATIKETVATATGLADAAGPLDLLTEKLDGIGKQSEETRRQFEKGIIGKAEYGQQMQGYADALEQLAKNLEALGTPEAKQAAESVRALQKAAEDAAGPAYTLEKGLKKLENAARYAQDVFKQLGGVISDFGGVAGNDLDLGKVAGDIADGFAGAGQAVGGFTKLASGDLTGIKDIVLGVVGAVNSFGNAILALSPGFAEWKKNLLEIAEIEKKSVGSKTVGNFTNPYYDELQKDAGNRDKLANASFGQRFLWLFTGAPKVLEDGAAKLKSKAAEIFNDLGSTISTSLTDSLINAFETGDFSGVGEAFDKSINKLVASMAIKTIIAGSQLAPLIKKYSDDYAAAIKDGVIDGTEQGLLNADIGNIKGEVGRVSTLTQGTLSGLPGFGEQGAPAGSIASLTSQISKLEEALSKATSDSERSSISQQITGLQRQKDNLTPTSGASLSGGININASEGLTKSLASGVSLNLDALGTFAQAATTLATASFPLFDISTKRFDASVTRQMSDMQSLFAQYLGTPNGPATRPKVAPV